MYTSIPLMNVAATQAAQNTLGAANTLGGASQGGYNPSLWESLLGQDSQLAPTLGAIGGLAQSWLGFKNLGLMEDQLAFKKDAFTQNYNQQAQSYNTQLQDRQNARLNGQDSSPFYQSVGAYMNQNKAKEFSANG